jgi:hypothetical protein
VRVWNLVGDALRARATPHDLIRNARDLIRNARDLRRKCDPPLRLGEAQLALRRYGERRQASAHHYSLVQTAWGNELEPAYLRRLFAQLPKAKTVEDFEMLLPFNAALAGSVPERCTAANASR